MLREGFLNSYITIKCQIMEKENQQHSSMKPYKYLEPLTKAYSYIILITFLEQCVLYILTCSMLFPTSLNPTCNPLILDDFRFRGDLQIKHWDVASTHVCALFSMRALNFLDHPIFLIYFVSLVGREVHLVGCEVCQQS